MVIVHSYITWAGATQFVVGHAAHASKAEIGGVGTRTMMLTEPEARKLHELLTRALATPPQCIDCGSTMHTVDDPSCPVSNAAERDCAD
jgi:hypothetical protein